MAILTRRASIENVRSLGNDMVSEIILRLPIESVARSKCVSKAWHATISDDYLRRKLPLRLSVLYFPDAVVNSNTTTKSPPRFACAGGGGGKLEDRDLGFFPFMDTAVVCDASNGLLLLRAAGTTRFFVVDPVTRRWSELPPPSRDPRLSMLAFDPSSSSSGAGRCYRVVNFTGRWRESGGEVEVFSTETMAWAPPRDVEFGVPAAALSGSMHFHGGAVYALAADPDCVVRMDLAGGDLTCAVAELPEARGGDGRLAHSDGRLHYVATTTSDGGGARGVLKVWVLDGESPVALRWRLKHAVRLDGVVAGDGDDEEVRFMALHPEKDAAYMSSAGRVVELDLARKEVTGVWEVGGEGEKNRVVKAWLVPSSLYLSDCLADAHVQVQC
ncbi:hypothetical protein HU200_013897 [Digitaria exilis]|uniref:F-box domain-containing protein n=1 Tax=Digitaria exilis TaxID=1010633 RepID=A0A835KJ83_9POAL|nr:hypothetical protein HU200_013897 [Digitaria exilis]